MAPGYNNAPGLAEIAQQLPPPCECGDCYFAEWWTEAYDPPRVYTCSGCKRDIPWCLGSDGKFVDGVSNFEYCNDCVAVIDRFLSATLPRPSQP